ncbi:MAG TPA: ABC transporter ATP-binding protein, partial [Porphyromonadaceae bacterium]|nr:ABC transporter ATP-binding protein [Porphyromonadaceae bacterium]
NPEIARYCSRNILLRDGHVVEDRINPTILSAREALDKLPKNED